MRSRAHIKGHPLHAILVTFPIAFLTSAFILDGLRLLTGRIGFEEAAFYATAGGLLGGVIAAVPGLIDYIYSVPPASSASRRGAWHGFLNGTALMLFTATLLMRVKTDAAMLLITGLEGGGVGLLTIAGWMGGTLLVRNQIGVDHRYAQAGKWKEAEAEVIGGRVKVPGAARLKLNQMMLLRAGTKRIVVARSEKGLVAFDDHCTHRGGSLADGALICGTVQCPWHGSQFDVRTGAATAGPASGRIETYPVIGENNEHWLVLSHS
jgi:nitrite reductase/ring-hydroxylating ferredoxin subunit/uncharacterized membrane protein